MDIRIIEKISPESDVGEAIHNLVCTQLGNEQSLEATLGQIGYESGKAILVGGFVNSELATMNAFMPQSFVRSNRSIVGYQSGFSATDGNHRGKGYWPKLMAASIDIMRSKGAGFIFGFPNPVSQPLFEKKLGFTTAPMWRVVAPELMGRMVKFETERIRDCYRPNLRELADLKRQGDVDLIQVEADGCFAFGKVRSAKGLRFVDIGGLASEDGRLNNAVRLLCKAARAPVFRFEADQRGMLQNAFWPKRVSRPVIFKALNDELSIGDISLVGGLADNY
jgi:hypothetical protein